jgi:DNA-binding HxlR family transcriptional regulator
VTDVESQQVGGTIIPMMDRRAYNQFCALAVALDRLGERWTLLVIRELLVGPKRYSDLRDGLPGIAANLLAQRLRTLEADGIVRRRRLPKPAASTVYELTDVGRDLEPTLMALMRWGGRFMTRPAEGETVRASWFGLALQALSGPDDLAGITADFQLDAPDETVHLHVADGTMAVSAAPIDDADARLTTDPRLLFRIAAGGTTLDAEVAAGRASVEGTPEGLNDLRRTLHFPAPPPKSASS